MAKLSKRLGGDIAYRLYKLVMVTDETERTKILNGILDSLGVETAQREQGLEDAKRVLSNAKRQSAGQPAGNLDAMRPDELERYIRHLDAQRSELLAERAALQTPAETTPEPPAVEEEPKYKLTAKQRRRLDAFDALSDDDQVDSLRGLFGEDGQL